MLFRKFLYLIIFIIQFNSFSQNNLRDNFKQSFWKDYAGVYSAENNSTVLISLDWGDKIIYSNLETNQHYTLPEQKKDLFSLGDSVSIIFNRNKFGIVTSLIFNLNKETLDATKRQIKFEEIKILSGEDTISGTLIEPAKSGPFPVLIINGGASWIIRDTNLDEAFFYVSQSIAAFVYDKRGWGESTGNQTVPFQKTANDIKNIANFLKLRMDINPQKIGISTYSQSGWYGTLASSQSDVISFQILNVPSATTVHRQERQRVENELRVDEFNKIEVQEALKLFDLMSVFSTTGKNWDDYIKFREEKKNEKWFRYLFAPKDNLQETWEWGRLNWMYNPLAALIKTTIPTLVLLGEKDQKVLAEVNRSIFEESFELAGNRDHEIHIIPKMNHDLQLAYKGGRKEINRNLFAPLIFKIKREWLQRILK